MEKLIANFFWSAIQNEQRIHWIAWDKLTVAKLEGGMGFRNLYYFNLALLAKQVWRMLTQPDLLVAKVLKEKYFPKQDILGAALGQQPSFLWRSFRAAAQIIKDGSAWRIGNGEEVVIGRDNWIGVDKARKPVLIKDSTRANWKVSTLIDLNKKEWRKELIKEIFNEEDEQDIIAIPLGIRNIRDRRFWRFTKHGNFTVKSAYYAAFNMEVEARNCRASTSSKPKIWTKLWDTNTLPRIKLFAWKACKGALPVKQKLKQRGVYIDPICNQCGEDIETIDHLLLYCEHARRVWYLSELRLDVGKFERASFENVLWNVLNLGGQQTTLFLATAWEIWKARNRWEFEKKRSDPHTITRKAWIQWSDIEETREPKQTNKQSSNPQKWEKPPKGRLKMNVDVAVLNEREIGMACVIRDEEGRPQLICRDKCLAQGSSVLLEGIAMRFAMTKAKQHDKRVDYIESDSLQLIQYINKKTPSSPYVEVIVKDIQEVAKEIANPEFHHIRREANQVAHTVAAKGPNCLCINYVPRYLEEVIMYDM